MDVTSIVPSPLVSSSLLAITGFPDDVSNVSMMSTLPEPLLSRLMDRGQFLAANDRVGRPGVELPIPAAVLSAPALQAVLIDHDHVELPVVVAVVALLHEGAGREGVEGIFVSVAVAVDDAFGHSPRLIFFPGVDVSVVVRVEGALIERVARVGLPGVQRPVVVPIGCFPDHCTGALVDIADLLGMAVAICVERSHDEDHGFAVAQGSRWDLDLLGVEDGDGKVAIDRRPRGDSRVGALFEFFIVRGRAIECSPDLREVARALQDFLTPEFGIDFPLHSLQFFLTRHLAFDIALGVDFRLNRCRPDQQRGRDGQQRDESVRS